MERLRRSRTMENLRTVALQSENQNLAKSVIDSPVGQLLLVVDESAVVWLGWIDEGLGAPRKFDPVPIGENEVSKRALTQLSEYFRGERQEFDVPLKPEGSPFQKKVWGELRKIPYGQIITYGEQAKRLGIPKAPRAVGAANGQNPISIIVPCHRVVGQSGKLTGFGGGLHNKEKLLQLEGLEIMRERVRMKTQQIAFEVQNEIGKQ